MKKIILLATIILIIVACGSTSVNDVGFKDRVSNALTQVDLVANNVLLESLSDKELTIAVESLDNIINFRSFWIERITMVNTPLTLVELNDHYNILLSSYKSLEKIVKPHWNEFTKSQQTSFRLLQINLNMLNVTYQTAMKTQSLTLAADQAIVIANLALRIMAVP